jgi:hypothetical protein
MLSYVCNLMITSAKLVVFGVCIIVLLNLIIRAMADIVGGENL